MATTSENQLRPINENDEFAFLTPSSSPTPEKQFRPIQDTLKLVRETKFILRNEGIDDQPVEQSKVEFAVATAKMNYDPVGFSFDRWRNSLAKNFRQDPADILLRSMAYINQHDDIEEIYQEKLKVDSVSESTAESASLDALTEKLNTFQRALNLSHESPLAGTVRRIHKQDPERAIRYFLVEIVHRIPSLDEYTWNDAKVVVDGILQTTCEIENLADLLTLTKVCNETDVIDWFKQLQIKADEKPKSNVRSFHESTDDYE